jgi:hypothetical protein
MKNERIEEVKRDIEKEFPNDFALQQIHVARKLLAEEAKEKGISFWKYIKMQAKETKHAVHGV